MLLYQGADESLYSFETKQDFILLYEKYAGMVYRLICGYIKNETDAQEALQTVFVTLWADAKTLLPAEQKLLLHSMKVTREVIARYKRQQPDAIQPVALLNA